MNGFIKLDRKILDWEWYGDPNTRAVFIDLLLNANYKDGNYKGVLIKRGQAVFGRKATAERLGISEKAVRTALNHLKSTNEVAIKTASKFSVVTIENYEKYQGELAEGASKGASKTATKGPAEGQQGATSKKERKERKGIIQEYIMERNHKQNPYIEDPQDGDLVPGGQGAFYGARYRKQERLSEEESTQLLKAAHEQFAPIKLALMMKGANK